MCFGFAESLGGKANSCSKGNTQKEYITGGFGKHCQTSTPRATTNTMPRGMNSTIKFPEGCIPTTRFRQPPFCGRCFMDIQDHLNLNSLHFIFLMDLLEHIKNDSVFFKSAPSKLRTGGCTVITGPALQIIFSSHHRYLQHYRRYRIQSLEKVISESCTIPESFYFYHILFWVRFAQCIIVRSSVA